MTVEREDSTLNAISFDLEHWYSATLLSDAVDEPIDRVEESTAIVLDLLEEYDVEATFFVVGELANEHPELLRRIRDDGHELGSHGHTHTPLFELTPDQFESELTRSSEAIRAATGREPIGFRAPNFSVTRKTQWAFRVLESSGYAYDSSVFPLKTPMYGVSGAPRHPYEVALDAPFEVPSGERSTGGLVESPLAVADAFVAVPIAGGFYARLLPGRLIEWGIRQLNGRGIPANLYFHPWEFNPEVRFDSLPAHKRFISFHGIDTTERTLARLLDRFDFGTVRDSIERWTPPG